MAADDYDEIIVDILPTGDVKLSSPNEISGPNHIKASTLFTGITKALGNNFESAPLPRKHKDEVEKERLRQRQ